MLSYNHRYWLQDRPQLIQGEFFESCIQEKIPKKFNKFFDTQMCSFPGASNIKNNERNCCRIVVSQSVCHCHSLPLYNNICKQGQEPPLEWSPTRGSTGVGSSLDFKHKTRVANTLAYYVTVAITAVKSFMVQATGVSRASCS